MIIHTHYYCNMNIVIINTCVMDHSSIIFYPYFVMLSCLSRMGMSEALSILDAPHTHSSKEEIFEDFYPQSNVSRVKVSGKARHDWEVPLKDYNPPYFTHHSVLGQPWADTEFVRSYRDKFNQVDDDLDRRRTSQAEYDIEKLTGRPLNPSGRTGLCGRGLLGRWGPNHQSLIIVTRWFRDHNDHRIVMPSSKKPLLEFVAVKFYGEWGVPGGFVQPKETYMERAQLEFLEEALNASNMTESYYKGLAKHLDKFYEVESQFVYQGYIKDNRNTDNAWIEGRVSHVHDKEGHDTIGFELRPGDGAQDVKWLIAHRDMSVNPQHKEFLRYVTDILDAHW